MLYLIQFIVFVVQFAEYESFSTPSLTLSHLNLREPIEFSIQTRMDWQLERDEVVIFSLPKFTRSVTANGYTTAGSDISFGNVRISPSMTLEAAWVEGNLEDPNFPFSTSQLQLRLLPNVTVSSNFLISVTVFKDANISVYCGFPGFSKVSKGASSTDIHMFYVYSSLNEARDRSNTLRVNNQTFASFPDMGQGCIAFQECHGNGDCDYCYEKCICSEGFGNNQDAPYIGGGFTTDCASRMCPRGKAIVDLASSPTQAHALTECSNAGICDRATGTCQCFHPFTGSDCSKFKCPNDCSGHGTCLSMSEYGLVDEGQPTQKSNYKYGTAAVMDSSTWDAESVHVCLCDSSWAVGMHGGQTQLPEWFGPDCSLRRCPTGDDPYTHLDETNCHQLNQHRKERFGLNMMIEPDLTNQNKGEYGNKCHIDCSNRGICDYNTGKCTCFPGSFGTNCGKRSGTGQVDYAGNNEPFLN